MFHHRCRRHTAPLGVSRVGGTLSVGSMSCLRAQDTTSSGRCAFVACRFSLERIAIAFTKCSRRPWMPAYAGMTEKGVLAVSFPRKRESSSWQIHLQPALGCSTAR